MESAKKRENEKSHSHYSLCYSVCIPITTAVGDADVAAQTNTTRYLELTKIKGGRENTVLRNVFLFFLNPRVYARPKNTAFFFGFFTKKKAKR